MVFIPSCWTYSDVRGCLLEGMFIRVCLLMYRLFIVFLGQRITSWNVGVRGLDSLMTCCAHWPVVVYIGLYSQFCVITDCMVLIVGCLV